jgi:hypothetical protein
METDTTLLPPHLQRLIDAGVSGTDILHGHLKFMMLEAEQILDNCIEVEEESGEAMDSMERTNAEGFLDALVQVYQLTYQLAFAINERTKARESR